MQTPLLLLLTAFLARCSGWQSGSPTCAFRPSHHDPTTGNLVPFESPPSSGFSFDLILLPELAATYPGLVELRVIANVTFSGILVTTEFHQSARRPNISLGSWTIPAEDVVAAENFKLAEVDGCGVTHKGPGEKLGEYSFYFLPDGDDDEWYWNGFRITLVLDTPDHVRNVHVGPQEGTVRVYRKGLKFSVLTDDGEMCTDHGVADTKAVAPTDAPFLYFSMAIYEGVAYICGGKRGTEDVYDFTAKCFQIELLSSGVDPRPYESIAAMSCPRFGGGNLAAYEWKLYVMAGACNCAANMRNSIEIYDIATNAWSVGAARMPDELRSVQVISDAADVFVLGGKTCDGVKVRSVYHFDAANPDVNPHRIHDLPGSNGNHDMICIVTLATTLVPGSAKGILCAGDFTHDMKYMPLDKNPDGSWRPWILLMGRMPLGTQPRWPALAEVQPSGDLYIAGLYETSNNAQSRKILFKWNPGARIFQPVGEFDVAQSPTYGEMATAPAHLFPKCFGGWTKPSPTNYGGI